MDRKLLTILEAAAALRIGRTKMCELIASRQIATIRIGRAVRVPAGEIDRWIEAQTADQGR